MKKKKRETKRIYLVREAREIYDRLSGLSEFRWNKILAHILDIHGESYAKNQVIDAQWVVFKETGNGKEDIRHPFTMIPTDVPGIFIKADKSLMGREIIENYRAKIAKKDAGIEKIHRKYIEADIIKHLLTTKVANRILELAGLSPITKELNP